MKDAKYWENLAYKLDKACFEMYSNELKQQHE